MGHVPSALDEILTSMAGKITGEARKTPDPDMVLRLLEVELIYHVYNTFTEARNTKRK